MIETENLTKKFGDTTAVDRLTMRIEDGQVFGLLGPNGAGKTTTVRMLVGLISKTAGEARLGGYEIGDNEDSMKIRGMIGLLPENVGLYEELSAYTNLDLYARLYGCEEAQRKASIERLLKMLGLWERRDRPAGSFSKGMKQKVAIARALVHDPQMVFMDEPTANLDPESTRTVREFILELKKEKKTIFLNTHNLDEAQRVCDKIGILNTRLMAFGTPEELEKSVERSKTVIQLEQASDGILAALGKLPIGNLVVDGSRLTIDVADPEKENAAIVDAIVGAGGHVRSVTVVGSSLEDAYLKLVRDAK